MDDIDNIKETPDIVNDNFEHEMQMAKLREELKKRFDDYQTTMKFMLADAPIEVLCLPQNIEKILLDHGFLRIYDLFDVDLTKIKGLGVTRIRHLTTSLNKFFSMF